MCEDILKEGLKVPHQEAMIGINGQVRPDTNTRRSKIRFVNFPNDNFKSLYDDIWKTAIMANKDWFNFHITKLDYIQLAEYEAANQGEYKEHQDVFWINNDPFYHRKLTCLIQLSDPNDYEGGEFEVCNVSEYPNADDIKQQGTIIFIPSFVYHKANPVTKGTRYSIAAWIEGPKWS
jgi:PKHD-type hydroxylase